MSRPWREPVQDWPALRRNQWYLLHVLSLDKVRDPPAIRLLLEFLEEEHAGRTHVVLLPLPIRPAGPTAEFFIACGALVVAGGTVAPKDALGAEVRVQFVKGEGCEWQALRIAPMENAAPAESAGPMLAGSQGEQACRTSCPRAGTGRRGRALPDAPGEMALERDSHHHIGSSAATTEPEDAPAKSTPRVP